MLLGTTKVISFGVSRYASLFMPDQQQKEQRCVICGSRFAERKCYFCENKVCTSCIVPVDLSGSYTTTKCISCDRKKIQTVSFFTVVRRNLYIIGILVAFWLFTVFPIPFMQIAGLDVNPTAFQPVLIATALIAIPFVFMFIAWQKRAPRGSQ